MGAVKKLKKAKADVVLVDRHDYHTFQPLLYQLQPDCSRQRPSGTHCARPGGHRMTNALVSTVIASSVSFGIYFAVAGSFFLDAYKVPPYKYEDWHPLAGVALGLLATVVVTVMVLVVKLVVGLFGALRLPSIVKPTVGGPCSGSSA